MGDDGIAELIVCLGRARFNPTKLGLYPKNIRLGFLRAHFINVLGDLNKEDGLHVLKMRERHYSDTLDNIHGLVEEFEGKDWTPEAFSLFLSRLVEIINIADDLTSAASRAP